MIKDIGTIWNPIFKIILKHFSVIVCVQAVWKNAMEVKIGTLKCNKNATKKKKIEGR